MDSNQLRIRVGQLNDSHAHLTLYDDGGHAGSIILKRATWNAIEETGDTVTGPGDYVDVDVAIIGVAKGGVQDPEARRSMVRGRDTD